MLGRIFLVVGCSFILLSTVFPQSSTSRTWVYFRDKGPVAVRQDQSASLGISERAMKRRAKVLPQNRLVDELDLPVASEYLDQLRSLGVVVHSTSRWLNAASVEATPVQIEQLAQLNVVAAVKPVMTKRRPRPAAEAVVASPLAKTSADILNYGSSAPQNTRTKVIDLHSLGINGAGILLGFEDDGFNYHATHTALKNLPVIAEYDFIQRDNNTSIAPGEYSAQGEHGRNCMSIAAGFMNGSLIGPAYGATFALAKTEIDSVEIHTEEDNYVEGLEWLERLGADIVSTSLGYDNFLNDGYDPGDIVYRMKDGKTGTTSKAAMIAARKGVLLVTAMGNEGWYRKDTTWTTVLTGQTGSLITPADADSIVSVGAASSTGVLTSFSSTGPTADGRTKPEVVNQGSAVYHAYGPASALSLGDGTSYATPLTAGAAACILSAHPELTPMQLREALMKTAIQDKTDRAATYPNNYYGSGYVNALDAALYWGLIFSNRPTVLTNDTAHVITTKIRPKAGTILVADSLFLYYKKSSASTYERSLLVSTGVPYEYRAIIKKTNVDSSSVGYFSARDDAGNTRKSPFNGPDSVFVLKPTGTTTGVEEYSTTLLPGDMSLTGFPNPFNPSATLEYHLVSPAAVRLSIYDLLGREVALLVDEARTAGTHSVTWNASSFPSGVYAARLQTAAGVRTAKLVLMK